MQDETALRKQGHELLRSAFEYWARFQKEVGHGAVVWTEGHDGAFVLFTRGEYVDRIKALIASFGGSNPEYVFRETDEPLPLSTGAAAASQDSKWRRYAIALAHGACQSESMYFDDLLTKEERADLAAELNRADVGRQYFDLDKVAPR